MSYRYGFLATLLACTPAYAELTTLDLDNLIRRTITTNPIALAASSEIEATQVEEQTARLQILPTPNLQTTISNGERVTRLRLDQPLWTNGKLSAGINQARFTTYAARANAELQRYTVAGQVVDAWSLLVQSEEKARIASLTITQLTRYEEMMQRRVNAGVSARIELDLIRSRVLQSQVNREGALALRRLGIARIQELTGERLAPSAISTLPPLSRMAAEASARFDQRLIDQTTQVGDWHPSVLKAQYQAEAAAELVRVRRADRFPGLYLTYIKDFGGADTTESSGAGAFALGLQYAPGAGFSAYGSGDAANARLQGLLQSQEVARREVVNQVQTSLQDYLSASGRMQSLQAAAKGAQIVLESYERQFIAGRKSWLEVLNAVREIEQNAYSLAEAHSTLVAAAYRIQLQTGRMSWQQRGIQ